MNRRRTSIYLAALVCFLRCSPSSAADSPVAPLLYDEAFLVVRVDLEKVQLQPLYDLFDRSIGRGAFPSQRSMETFLAELRDARAKELYVVWGGDTGIWFVPLGDNAQAVEIKRALMANPLERLLPVELSEPLAGGIVAGRRSLLVHLRDLKAAPRPHLAAAIDATSDCTVQFVLLPIDANRQRAAEFKWPGLEGDATRAATECMLWGSLGIDGPPQPRMKMAFEAQDAASVDRLDAALRQSIDPMVNDPAVHLNLALVEHLRAIFTWQRRGNRLSLDIDDRAGELTVVARGMVQPVVEPALEASARSVAMTHLRQIGIALFNHHDVFKKFPPPAILDPKGKPLLSWRVKILPFIDEGALYRKFRLDEPWDSPHNKQLLAEMPEVYQCPLAKVPDDHTVFLGPSGQGGIFSNPQGISIRNILDGTSVTIAVVEVDDEHAVPWTKPQDWTHDPDEPAAGLGGHFRDRFLVEACDGATHAIPLDIDPHAMRGLISHAGREMVRFPH